MFFVLSVGTKKVDESYPQWGHKIPINFFSGTISQDILDFLNPTIKKLCLENFLEITAVITINYAKWRIEKIWIAGMFQVGDNWYVFKFFSCMKIIIIGLENDSCPIVACSTD